jgi:exodeoxyribonuclease V gamma subunit
MWATLRGRAVASAVRRRDDDSALAVTSPLLASLARDTRELQLLLVPAADVHHAHVHHATVRHADGHHADVHHADGDHADGDHTGAQHTDGHPAGGHHPGGASTRSLLGAVQAAVRDDVLPTPSASADGTLQVHACHGPARQVEVLREALLHLFAEDLTLEPRDVLVMCPDVETYAPLVRAAFGQPGASHPGHRLRVRLADRSLRSTNPLLDTLSGLLALADSRVRASQVLDLAATAPVRRAFGLRDDDLERLREWAGSTGVRWGLGRRQREAYALHAVPQNTWDTGLDRLLLGVAADETDLAWLGLALPLDDVDSSDIDLTGRLAELVERLDAVLRRLHGPQPVGSWIAVLSDALDLLTAVPDEDAWQLVQARRQLSEAAEHGTDLVLRLSEVRALLAGRLAGRPTRANFRTGELTVCTMVPMRSVPHRVVALLGLDDGVFPRAGSVDGDDVLQREPLLGERDVRSEDRQLLLDAVMSAGDHLLLLHTGADPVTGAVRPPSVPLGELLDVVRATAGGLGGVVHRHPLQPFAASDFVADRPFSHDTAALAGAQAAAGPRRPQRGLLTAPLAPRPSDVELPDLVAFLVHPARAFLRRRLEVHVPDAEPSVADALRAELEGLQRWEVGERMLSARLAGVDATAFAQAEWRRGTLPPGPLGMRLLVELEAAVEPLLEAARQVQTGAPRTVDVVVELASGRRLSGTVSGLHDDVLVSTSFSTLAPKHRMPAWVRLLTLAAGSASAPSAAVTLGRGPFRRPVWRSALTVPPDPAAVLRDLVALYDEGMCEPLPVAPGASADYAARRASGSTVAEALDAADAQWSSRFGDGTDRHLAYVHGVSPRLSALSGTPSVAGATEPTRFGALARRLWDPLLACEQLGAP